MLTCLYFKSEYILSEYDNTCKNCGATGLIRKMEPSVDVYYLPPDITDEELNRVKNLIRRAYRSHA